MLPTYSPCLSHSSVLGASDSTISKSFLEGLQVPKESEQQTLHDLTILFLTSKALNESKQFHTLDLADIMTRLSELIAPEESNLSVKVNDTMRLDVILSQFSELVSMSKAAQKSLSTRIIAMIDHLFSKSLSLDSNVYTFVHQDPTGLFGDSVAPNLLALNKMMQRLPEIQKCAIYIPENDCGSWNITHYPTFLLPPNMSLSVKLIPTLKDSNQMDIKGLKEAIDSDINQGTQPMLIVCRVGTSLSTEHDNIHDILSLNKNYESWIHVEGIDAIFYALLDTTFTRYFDSINLDLTNWVPNLKLPKTTLFFNNPWVFNDSLRLNISREPWSTSTNAYRISLDDAVGSKEFEFETYLDLFSKIPPLKHLLSLWTWLTFQKPLILRKRLQSIRQSMYILKSDLSNIQNLVILSGNDKMYRGIMFRYESSNDAIDENRKETYDNLATRFIFSKITSLIPRSSLISINSKIFILLEIFSVDASLQELPGKISSQLKVLLKSVTEALALQKMVDEIPQLKYIHPHQLLSIEGDKPYSVLSLGGVVYTPDLLSLLSKSHPQVLMDLNPFQHKLYDLVSVLDISLGRSEDQVPCLILNIPWSFDDSYILEVIQVIMESAKTLESTTRMDQVAQVMQDRILKSQSKLDKNNNSVFGFMDSLLSIIESYFDADGINQPNSCHLELGD